jgi:hypothetical protein
MNISIWDFIKLNWKWMLLSLVILFIVIRTSKRKYFWKVKKTGEELTFKEFLKQWKKGVNGITPYQTAKSQIMGNIIVLVGIISGIIINILTRLENQWIWITTVLIGSLVLTSLSQIGYLQKYWRLKQIKETTDKLNKEKKK